MRYFYWKDDRWVGATGDEVKAFERATKAGATLLIKMEKGGAEPTEVWMRPSQWVSGATSDLEGTRPLPTIE